MTVFLAHRFPFLALALAGAVAAGCSDADMGATADPGATDVPPTDAAALADWLETGTYLMWSCEAAPHAPRAPSPHPRNRICTSPLAENASQDAPLPIGAASVKEIYASSGNEIVAYAVMQKVAEGDEATPGAYHYFEGAPGGTPAADGRGNDGAVAETVCYGCHSHAAENGGQEQFFTIVR